MTGSQVTEDVNGIDLQQTRWGAGRPACVRVSGKKLWDRADLRCAPGSSARRSTREPPGHAPWTLALGCGSAAPAPTPRPALPSSFMPAAGPPPSARSAAPLPAGGGATQSLVAGQERHLEPQPAGKTPPQLREKRFRTREAGNGHNLGGEHKVRFGKDLSY